MEERLFSIITVCYNAEKTIEKTILSVLEQDNDDYEYIIVDGASDDGTVEIIRKYANIETNRIKFSSEPDEGLYYAMNKAIGLSSGRYLEFLNAGDILVDSSVLSRVAKYIDAHKSDIYYGNIIYRYPDGTSKERVYTGFCSMRLYYLLGDCINHQAIFASSKCFKSDASFDTKYRYSADRDWMIRNKKDGKRFAPMDLVICYYSLDEESQSVANEKQMWKENKAIVKNHFPLGYSIYCVVDAIRNNRFLSKVLHKLYMIVFLKKA